MATERLLSSNYRHTVHPSVEITIMTAQFPMNDHDLLIKLNANLESFFQRYDRDIKELRDGTTAQLVQHDLRLTELEKVMTEVKPLKTLQEFRMLQSNFNEFIVGIKVSRYWIGMVTGTLGAALAIIVNYLLSTWGLIR